MTLELLCKIEPYIKLRVAFFSMSILALYIHVKIGSFVWFDTINLYMYIAHKRNLEVSYYDIFLFLGFNTLMKSWDFSI